MVESDFIGDFPTFVFTQNPIAMLILDENATILQANLAFYALTGYKEFDLFGKHISLLESTRNNTSLYDTCYKNTMLQGQANSCEIYVLCKNDEHLFVRNNNKNIMNDGKQYTIFTMEDITEQKRILEHYQYLSTHDPLTGLANRVLLYDNFKKAKDKAIANHQKMALLVCDINEFKQCNDSYGHDFGDTILKVVAKTLEALLRTDDTVARYGGDEFVLILEDIGHIDQISKIVMTIKAAFPIIIMHDEQACQVDMSIGCACFPDNGNNFNEIIQIADQNMYQEKKYFYGSD